jgi:DNA-binding response OmpR family regulator
MKKKILIIEDEKSLIDVYSEFLNEEGFDVMCVRTIEEVADLAKEFRADLLLIDHSLKGNGRSGLQALPDLRKWFPKAILILFSNYTTRELEKIAKNHRLTKNLKLADSCWDKLELGLVKLLKNINELWEK